MERIYFAKGKVFFSMKRSSMRLLSLLLVLCLIFTALPVSVGAAAVGRTTAYVNLRTGAGTNNRIIETVPLGAQLTVTDTSNAGWYRVTAPSGNSGYMCSDYIQITGGTAAESGSGSAAGARYTARTTAYVNLRRGAGTNYASILVVPYGASITVLEKTSASWYRVQYGSYTGYMFAQYIQITGTIAAQTPTPKPSGTAAPTAKPTATPTATPAPSSIGTAKTTAALNIRKGSSTSYASLGVLPNGTTVTLLEKCTNGWYKVRTAAGLTGYCSGDYLKVTLTGTATAKPTSTAAPTPAPASIGTARTTAALNIRKGPSTSYASQGVLANGTALTVLEKCSNGWYHVRTSSNTVGYCSGSYLRVTLNTTATPKPNVTATPKPTAGVVTATPKPTTSPTVTRWNGKTTAYVNLRSGPSTGYSIYLTIPLNASITVLDRSNSSWYRIQYKSYTGYMSASYIKVLGTATPTPRPTPTPNSIGTAHTTAVLNIRTGPSTSYSSLGLLANGATVTLVEKCSNGWYKVRTAAGLTGYCSGNYLHVTLNVSATPKPTSQPTAAPTPPPSGTVDTTDLLLLVNPWNSIPSDYKSTLFSIGDGEYVDQRCYTDLKQMLNDCTYSGMARPYVCSSYRTNVAQTQLYENKVTRLVNQGYSLSDARVEAAKVVALPGTSEHQLGLAVDIIDLSYPQLDAKQKNTATQRWLMQNSWKYGFILRYPIDKTAVTGITYEPWHYRYVGRENAKAIYESGLCLEEYLKAQGK